MALIEAHKAAWHKELWGAFSLGALNMLHKFLALRDKIMDWQKYKLYLPGIAVEECLISECPRKNIIFVVSWLSFYFTRNQTEQECPLFHCVEN